MRKIQTSVTLSPNTIEWINKKIEQSIFRSASHAIDYLVSDAQRKEEAGR